MVMLQLAHVVVNVPTDVADRDARLFDPLPHVLRQLSPAVLRQWWDRKPDDGAVVRRRESQVGLQDRLFDGTHRASVIRLNNDEPRVRRGDRGELIEGGWRPVIVDP